MTTQSPCVNCDKVENDKNDVPCAECVLISGMQSRAEEAASFDAYARACWYGGEVSEPVQMCKGKGCTHEAVAHGLCSTCYQRERRARLLGPGMEFIE